MRVRLFGIYKFQICFARKFDFASLSLSFRFFDDARQNGSLNTALQIHAGLFRSQKPDSFSPQSHTLRDYVKLWPRSAELARKLVSNTERSLCRARRSAEMSALRRSVFLRLRFLEDYFFHHWKSLIGIEISCPIFLTQQLRNVVRWQFDRFILHFGTSPVVR